MLFEKNVEIDGRVNINPSRFKQVINKLKEIFNYKSIPYILILLVVSNVSFLGVKPFAIVMLAMATIFNVSLVLPLVVTLISYLVFGASANLYVNYGLAYVIYVAITMLIEVEGRSKKQVTLIKVGVATAISNFITFLIFKSQGYTVYNMLMGLVQVLAFYMVFTSGLSMIINIMKKIIFSKEEIISACVVLTLILIPFKTLNILGFSIVNVILMSVIMLVSWKNDWLTGTATGALVGLVYAIGAGQTSLIITTFAFSGFIAGILCKYNKWIVTTAFVAGNVILSYIYTKDLTMWSKLAELLVSSAVILVLPRKVMLKLEDLFGTSASLNRGYENLLGPGSQVSERLNAMSEVFDNLAHITTPVTEETIEETKSVIKKYLEDYKKNECISCKNKFTCLSQEIDIVAEHIAKRLEENKPITQEMLPIDCGLKDELITNICDIYNNIKLMRIVRQKENEASKKLAEEYKAISGLIKNIARDNNSIAKVDTPEQKRIREELKYMGYTVYEDTFEKTEDDATYEFITDILIDIDKAKKEIQKIVSDVIGIKMNIKLVLNSSKTEKSRIKLIPSSRYTVKAVVKQIRKADSAISGDSYIVTELKDNSKIIAISDGMGSGAKSKEVSETVVSMISKMGAGGFNKQEIINIINRLIKLKESGDTTATLDMCAINEKTNKLEFIKLGAAPSYVISNGEIFEIKKDNMPMGVMTEVGYSSIEKDINKGDYVVLISDGAMTDVNKLSLQNILESLANETDVTEKVIMDKIMKDIVENQNKIVLDDITVVVCKIA